MPYQYLYDDFTDNSIDASRWSQPTPNSGLHVESGGRLLTPCAASSAPTVMRSYRNWYDLRKGRLAVRFSRSGTTNSDVYTFFGLRDNANNTFTLFARSNDHTLQIAGNTAGTGTATQIDNTIGLGPSWTANTWLGWTYTESTKTYSLSKSTNLTTWTEIYKYVVTTSGAFKFRQAGWFLGCTSYGAVTNFTPSWDEPSYIAYDADLQVRVRYGGSWVNASPKVRVGGAWKRPIGKVLTGPDFVRAK
jgi:hypothetical protein